MTLDKLLERDKISFEDFMQFKDLKTPCTFGSTMYFQIQHGVLLYSLSLIYSAALTSRLPASSYHYN